MKNYIDFLLNYDSISTEKIIEVWQIFYLIILKDWETIESDEKVAL